MAQRTLRARVNSPARIPTQSRSSHTSLHSLPVETLTLILQYLGWHLRTEIELLEETRPADEPRQTSNAKAWYSQERQPLVVMSRVCPQLRAIMQPMLYQEFVLGYGDSWRSDQYTWKCRLVQFVRTLARRPDLASMVTVVSVHPRLLDCINTADRKVKSVLREATRKLGVKYAEYRNAFYEAHPDHREDLSYIARGMLLGVLIAQLPNLRHLRILGPRLESVDTGSAGIPLSAWQLLGVTTLSLRTIDFRNLNLDNVAHILDMATGLTELRLFQCSGSGGNFTLEEHRQTLTSLHQDLETRPLPDLRQFLALEDLYLTNYQLSGPLVRVLPPNIVSLKLRGGDVTTIEQDLVELASAVSHGSFPRLRKIRCYYIVPGGHEFRGADLLAGVGIDFAFDLELESQPQMHFLAPEEPIHFLGCYLDGGMVDAEPMPLPDLEDDEI